MERSAILSPDKWYRYYLTRIWDENKQSLLWLGLNPSSADAEKDDPTVKKWMQFAKQWGFGGYAVLNLFAYRTSSPRDLISAQRNIIGPENNYWIHLSAKMFRDCVVCWGNGGVYENRDIAVLKLLEANSLSPMCLGTNGNGTPRHPLYLPLTTERKVYEWRTLRSSALTMATSGS